MTSDPVDTTDLAVALDQVADLLGRVGTEHLDRPTSCSDWTVRDLVDHVVNAPAHFATAMRGEEPDWAAPPPEVAADPLPPFRATSGELVAAWRTAGDPPVPMDWQLAELAVHAWDLAQVLGETTDTLDAGVAEQGLSFMQANLRPEIRGQGFGPEQPAPADADAYGRIAAFAGRRV